MEMDTLEICRACACFIKRTEVRCPFCGATHVAVARPPLRGPRMSRATWLAVGSALAVAGCGGSVSGFPGSGSTQSTQGAGASSGGGSSSGGDARGDDEGGAEDAAVLADATEAED